MKLKVTELWTGARFVFSRDVDGSNPTIATVVNRPDTAGDVLTLTLDLPYLAEPAKVRFFTTDVVEFVQ